MKLYFLYAAYIPVVLCWIIAEFAYKPFEVLGEYVKAKIEIEHAKHQGGAE